MVTLLKHLLVPDTVTSLTYKSVISGGRTVPRQGRDRITHSEFLLGQLALLAEEEGRLAGQRAAHQLPTEAGMTLAIEVTPRGALDAAKIEWVRDRIQVLSVVEAGPTAEIITVHVPRGSLSAFEKRVREYAEKDGRPRKDGSVSPANAALINAVSAFRLAVFDELWTDPDPAPEPDVQAWFQVWLRMTPEGAALTRDNFAQRSERLGILVDPGYVTFPGRVVVAARATPAALQRALDLLDLVAEIRGVKPTAAFFLGELTPFEQAQWINDFRGRTQFAVADARACVTLLDTGVNRHHPLLAEALDDEDVHAVDAAWLGSDHDGHGSGMAGLSLHGNLTAHLAGEAQHVLEHRLESVKILPPVGANPRHLYGSIVGSAVQIVEGARPDRDRTFAMMTTATGETAGVPSEWSAQIDRLAFGMAPQDDGQVLGERRSPKLFVLAGGNIAWTLWEQYPASNIAFNIEDPGQSWNALTVGAYTNLAEFNATTWPSLRAISPQGALSPASRTSMTWPSKWPFKPDVVAEGGNGCTDHALGGVIVGPSDLRVLTTSHTPVGSMLAENGDTSAATAEVARICAQLTSRYPEYWPETVRALVVHGARWTRAMHEGTTAVSNGTQKRALLRTYGYGAVDFERSAVSSRKEVTLVLQEAITPYVLKDGSIKLGKLNLHALPWPGEVLSELEGATVTMRVTLSYFIEPNPAQRGWQSKFRYQSHGLRFAVKAASEDLERFQLRINKLEREALAEEGGPEENSIPDPDVSDWFLGAKLRTQGSVHSDVWTGTALSLAEKSHIAVYPVGGWWKDWKGGGRQGAATRYSLVVTLSILGETTADIYTPVANQIGIGVPPIQT